MKIRKVAILMLSLMMISMILLASAKASTFPNLPSTPVTVTVTTGPGVYPLTVVLSDVPAGYDVNNQTYTGWCDDLLTTISHDNPYSALLISSLTLSTPWDKINYILNHKTGTAQDVQAAIWLTEGFSAAQILANAGFSPSATAIALYNDADANGGDFVSGPGETVAVLADVEGGQDLIIELTVPGLAPGLTPGFWKNNLAVYLGLAKGNRGYSDPTGSPTVTKDTMGDFFDSLAGTYDLNQLYRELCPQLDGTTAAIRDAAANVFNVAAGLSPGPPWA